MLLRFSGFGGANKALHPLLVPPNIGVDSWNQKPHRGDLRPTKGANNVATVASSASTIYRMGRDSVSDTVYWLSWTTDVDVARGFNADDAVERTFWTGDGSPKWTDNSIGLASAPYPTSSGVRILGVPKPNADPTLTEQAAGTGTDETRAYVVTWVNDRGEESEPSAADTITCKPGATIRITRNATVPSGNYGLDKWRVYRTVADGETDYFYVAEATTGTSYIDESGAINLNSPLLSETWIVPPTGLKGLKALWNGMMVGFTGKSLRFCEPFRPFAWPIEYELVIDDTIVALARWRQNLLVLTVDKPYIVTGSSPDAMSVQPVEMNQACVAKRGVVEFGHGVAWPSPDGLAYLGESGARVLTAGLALREDWQALAPTTFISAAWEGLYVGSYNPGAGRKALILDPTNPAGLYFNDTGFVGTFADPLIDSLFVLNSTNVQKWDAGTTLTAQWDSRTERTEKPTCFAFGQVVADAYPVTVSVWAQGVLKVNAKSVTGPRPFRLPSGFLADEWKVRVSTSGAVQAVMLAHSSAELNAA